MDKVNNLILAEKIRKEIRRLRKKGYTYKIFYSVVNYSSTDFYNFMRGYGMKDDDLLLLKDYLGTIAGGEEMNRPDTDQKGEKA